MYGVHEATVAGFEVDRQQSREALISVTGNTISARPKSEVFGCRRYEFRYEVLALL